MTKKARRSTAKQKAPAWSRNAVTARLDADGYRIVKLPSLTAVGIEDDDRDAIFAYEMEHLGKMKATIRIGQRSQGHRKAVMVPVLDENGDAVLNGRGKPTREPTGSYEPMKILPKRLAEAGPIPSELRRFYDAKAITANGGIVPAEE